MENILELDTHLRKEYLRIYEDVFIKIIDQLGGIVDTSELMIVNMNRRPFYQPVLYQGNQIGVIETKIINDVKGVIIRVEFNPD